MNLTEKTIASEQIFSGKIITVKRDTALLPNGEQAFREVVMHPGGVCVAALTDKGEVLAVRQFRYPYSEVLLEIPAGKRDKSGEDPLECGKRELKEETGMYIVKIRDILAPSFSCTGVTDEKSVIVFCDIDGKIEECKFPDEEIQAGLYTKEEVRKLLKEECFSARTQTACYLWAKE